MTGFTWEDPAPATRGIAARGVWAERLAPLREHPGRWACFGRHKIDTAQHIKRGDAHGIERGEFETTCRDMHGREGTLFVRFVGHADLKAVEA